MSPPDTREDHSEVDEADIPEVQRFWKSMMDQFGSAKVYQDTLIERFKKSDEPEIIIVIDKLLTGFDAPRNAVLYIDKRLKDHNILQAIARVNRLYDGKEYGLIIDYRGIFGQLNDAIELYKALEEEGFDREDVDGIITNVLEEIGKLAQYHTNVWEVFNSVKNKSDTEAMQLYLEPENTRQKFYDALRVFANTLRLALGNARFHENTSLASIGRYKDDLKMFLSLKNTVKQRYGETVDYSSYEVQIRNMVNKYIGAKAVKQIVEPVDLFNIEDFERELGGVEGDAAVKIDTIIKNLEKRDWVHDPGVYNQMFNDIEDYLLQIKGNFDLKWNYEVIDRIIEQTLEIAKSREL